MRFQREGDVVVAFGGGQGPAWSFAADSRVTARASPPRNTRWSMSAPASRLPRVTRPRECIGARRSTQTARSDSPERARRRWSPRRPSEHRPDKPQTAAITKTQNSHDLSASRRRCCSRREAAVSASADSAARMVAFGHRQSRSGPGSDTCARMDAGVRTPRGRAPAVRQTRARMGGWSGRRRDRRPGGPALSRWQEPRRRPPTGPRLCSRYNRRASLETSAAATMRPERSTTGKRRMPVRR